MTRLHVLALTITLPLVSSSAFAQNTEDQNAFDFSLPGARSRAIGGAFVAIADDATSAYSNPAGLTQLFRPEISIEVRHWHLTNLEPSRGHAFGTATGIGVDTINGLVDDRFHNDITGLSFLSFVYPGNGWAVGVFGHQLSKYQMDRRIYGPFFNCSGGYRVGNTIATAPFCEPDAIVDGIDREFPKIQSVSVSIRSTGAAFAYDLPSRLSVGGALQFFNFSISSVNTVFDARDPQKYLPPNYADPQNVELVSRQFGSDHAFAVNVGVLWNKFDHWGFGGSFRQGPKFAFSTETVRGAASAVPGQVVVSQTDNPFHVPDTYSAGAVYRPDEKWRLSVEYDRVQYHQLIEDFRNTAFFDGSPESVVVSALMKLDDSNQIRGGGEYLMLLSRSRALAFRAGTWWDPNHQPYFNGDPATGLPAPRWAVLFPRRDGHMHVSGGIGFNTRSHFQLDAAVDFSELVDTFSISSVWRF